jgi:hypothetical protein
MQKAKALVEPRPKESARAKGDQTLGIFDW